MSRHYVVVLCASMLAATMTTNRAFAQHSWDGDCSIFWHDCCMQGGNFVNNWTQPPNSSSCPPLPGPNDSASISGTVDSQPYVIGLGGLAQSGTFLCRAQFLTINNGGGVYTSGSPLEPSVFQLLDGSIINLMDGATIDIGSFSTLDVRGGVVRMFNEPPALLTIAGFATLTKSADPGLYSSIDVPFENHGVIFGGAGLLKFGGGGSSNGLIDTVDGATIRFEGPFNGPLYELAGEVVGEGVINIHGGTTAIVGGNYHPDHTLVNGPYGRLNVEADTSINRLTLDNASLLAGRADLTVNHLVWHGSPADMLPGGTTIIQQSAIIKGLYNNGNCGLYRDMENLGQTVIEANATLRMDVAEFRNHGDLELRDTGSIHDACCTLDSGVKNFGTLRKTGAGTSAISALVSNSGGSIDVESGTLHLQAEMASTGPIVINAGATLIMGLGQQSLFPSCAVSGGGTLVFQPPYFNPVIDTVEGTLDIDTLTIAGSSVAVQSENNVNTFNLLGGELLGMGNFTVNDLLNWTSGEMGGAGVTKVDGTLRIDGYALLSRTLELNNGAAPAQAGSGTLHLSEAYPSVLRGSGIVGGHLNNRGIVAPGTYTSPVGAISVAGDLQYTCCWPTTQFHIDLAGAAHDQLSMSGAAHVGGTLIVAGTPAPGQSYPILVAQSVSGAFSQVIAPPGMTVQYTPTAVILHAAPAPDCPADINGDDIVNVADLLGVIAAWGPCSDPNNCPADVNNDGFVNVADLLAVIGAWGACP